MKLLLIHTGGTIGMAETPEGLAPMKGLVEEAIAARLPADTALTADVFDPLLDSADVGPRQPVPADQGGADILGRAPQAPRHITDTALDQRADAIIDFGGSHGGRCFLYVGCRVACATVIRLQSGG